MKKLIILIALMLFIPAITSAKYDLDTRYESPYYQNVTETRQYFYLGKIEMPLSTILDLQWWSDEGCYKKTLIVETYYFKGKVTKTVKCWKLLNWWEREKANCLTK